jgi:hypothetical protein
MSDGFKDWLVSQGFQVSGNIIKPPPGVLYECMSCGGEFVSKMTLAEYKANPDALETVCHECGES